MSIENINDKEAFEATYGAYEDSLYPMIMSLNYYTDSELVENLKNIIAGCGLSGGNIGFFFPRSFDPWDEDYFEKGVMFQWGGLGVIVSDATFYRYLSRGVKAYVELYPRHKTEILELLEEIREKYAVGHEDEPDHVIQTLIFDD
ncbi:ribonuclease toxin immunity protein CdiI [Enterococcus sp. LJL51]|uniref:ribonuclease toxin immunity protein CdiI n=1 Tax=Enterococcus sp. LJL51 TaxID=3416656 RepID=UPI003CF97345